MSTITVPRAVLEQALEALEATHYDIGSAEKQRLQAMDAISALRAALAQPEPRNQCGETCERAKLCAVCAKGLAQQEQEPAAWMVEFTSQNGGGQHLRFCEPRACDRPLYKTITPLYTHPPRRAIAKAEGQA
jgi:hypothetical protein